MFFLHLKQSNKKQINYVISSNSDQNSDDVSGTKSLKKSHANSSFICNKNALVNILKFLKDNAAKRAHSEVNEEKCKRIRECLANINEALWRLTIIEKYSENENYLNDFAILSNLLNPHGEIYHESSSDENASTQKKNLNIFRKKTKMRKRQKTQRNNYDEDNEQDVPQKRGKINKTSIKDSQSIITKMLTSPENLCALCLNYNDLTQARYIIETFKLQNTQLEKEAIFLENCQHTKKKLKTIFDKYIKQESQNVETSSTIEEIKKVAGIGFEASKIINIIEKCAQNNPPSLLTKNDHLIDKYIYTFPYLEQYKQIPVQSTVIFDLILNLANNYEITYNILTMIERNYGLSTYVNKSVFQQPQIHQNVGCIEFFRNLVQCLQMLQTVSKTNISIKAVLTKQCYTLKPTKLKTELEKEAIFQILFTDTSHTQQIESLKYYTKYFEELKSEVNYFNRFINYLVNLSKLLSLKNKNSTNTTELLQLNIKNIIGELLIEDKLTPLEIERTVNSLNLNLPHIIALNSCPDAINVIKYRNKNKNQEEAVTEGKTNSSKTYWISKDSIYSYVESHNYLLSYLLQSIISSKSNILLAMDQCFLRCLELSDTHILSALYDGNLSITALLSDYLDMDKFKRLNDDLVIKDICSIFRLENYLNQIIPNLIKKDISNIMIIESITDINLRADILLSFIYQIEDFQNVERLTKGLLLHKDSENPLDSKRRDELEMNLKNIEIFSQIANVLQLSSWLSASNISKKTPESIMKELLELKEYEIAHEWLQIVDFPSYMSNRQKLFNEMFLEYFIQTTTDVNVHLINIIESFSKAQVSFFYETNMNSFKNLSLHKHIIDYLCKNGFEEENKFENYTISLKILEFMPNDEREKNWNLLKRPLLIIEQLLMNTKFELLTKILENTRAILGKRPCKFCFEKRKNICNLTMSGDSTLGSQNSSEFILLNFDLYQRDHIITNECIDTILRIYAKKALEYYVNKTYSPIDTSSHPNDMTSLDSLCGMFVMPNEAPLKEDWIPDNVANYCMCCKRATFTMLTRRHHCRRCGRVVCYSCSTNRMLIPNLYDKIPVRTCNDCFKQAEMLERKNNEEPETSEAGTSSPKLNNSEWQLSGNITHDKLLREEFCYEHSPSVALCLSILSFHLDDEECVRFLLHHCRKFEKLIVEFPNPEIDYALVAKMLNCLALAAKVRGGPAECNIIREHCEIINSIVQNGCEALLPNDALNNMTLRKLGDSVVVAENWPLAFNIFVKCGMSTVGVMAAYGLSCLKAGCFETAREKFSHCMPRVSNGQENSKILNVITSETTVNVHEKIDIPVIKRPNKTPPLLEEIIKIIETTYRPPQPETLERANFIRNSNTSLTSNWSKRKENIPIHEPALNILNTFANLKQITQGNYFDNSLTKDVDNKAFVIRNSLLYTESLYYLLMYGSHSDIINFLIRHHQMNYALKYFILQNVDNEIFIHLIYLNYMKQGKVDYLIQHMLEIDNSLLIWKDIIIQTCRFLETKGLFNSLYHLQVLLKDLVRASMTCVKFYSMNCSNFEHLQNNSFHLINAQKHLQAELEQCQWEEVNFNKKRRPHKTESSFVMQMDPKTINCHINTLIRQLEVTKFLAKCEKEGKSVVNMLKEITIESTPIPVLFDSLESKIHSCILVLICGKNIEEGFGLAFRIIQDYKLQAFKIYGTTAKYLSRHERLDEVEKLINCIRSNNNGQNESQCDEVIYISIQSAHNVNLPEIKIIIDNLIKLIKNIEMKISCYIQLGQLKTAYLLAIQQNRLNDIKRIFRQAEITNQIHVKRLCEKRLNINH